MEGVEWKEWNAEGDGWEGMGRTEAGGGCRAGACVQLDRSRLAGFLGIGSLLASLRALSWRDEEKG